MNRKANRFPASAGVLTVLAMVLACTESIGQTSFWANGDGGIYSDPNNWQNGLPSQGGGTIYGLNGTYTIDIDINAINTSSLVFANSAMVQWNISADSYAISQLKVGSVAGTNNHLTVFGGLLDVTILEIAPVLGQGTLTLNGPVQATYVLVGGQASFPGYFAQTAGGSGTLVINDGATIHVAGLLSDNAGTGSAIIHNGGELSIHGLGRFNAGASPQSFTRVGDGAHTAQLNLLDSIVAGEPAPGYFDFGNETLSIAVFSAVEFDSAGGSLVAGNIVRETSTFQPSGEFNWVAGNIYLTGAEFRVGDNGQFGSSVTLSESKQMFAFAGTSIEAGSTLTLAGGRLETPTLSNNGGDFVFNQGKLYVTSGDLAVGSNGISQPGDVLLNASSTLSVNGHLDIEAGRNVNLSGGQLIAGSIGGGGHLIFQSGELTVLQGDLTSGPSGQLNPTNDVNVGIGSSINLLNGNFELDAGHSLAIAGGIVSTTSLTNQGSITVANGYLSANRIRDVGPNSQITVLNGGGIFSGGMERNNLVVNGGFVSVFDDGSQVEPIIDASLVGGYTGNSSLTLNGGAIFADNMKIGVTAGFVDTVTINGGELSTGNLNAANGPGSVLIFNGGILRTSNSLVDGPSRFVIGNGVTEAILELSGGTHTFVDGIELSTSGRIAGEGIIIGDLLSSGIVSPGLSPGNLDIDGDLISNGEILFEIESEFAFDTLFVSQTFEVGGVISVSLLNLDPQTELSFDLVDFGSFVDAGYVFDFSEAPLRPGLVWDTSSFATNGFLHISVVPEPSTLCTLSILIALRARSHRCRRTRAEPR